MALAERLLGAGTAGPSCETEADWYAYWNRHIEDLTSPAERALAGGMAADRLAWVFLSGYQGALMHCFPEFAGAGWGCFAVAEAQDSPCALTGTGPATLTGTKTWIAGAEQLDRLVVALDGVTRFVCVPRDAAGLTIELPRTPSFLAEMSQGVAVFDQTPIESVVEDAGHARQFRRAEPTFVLLALTGYLAAQSGPNGSVIDDAAAVAGRVEELVALLDERESVKVRLHAIQTALKKMAEQFVGETLPSRSAAEQNRWARDARLLSMFGAA